MSDCSLHKFDSKGNLIKEWVSLIKKTVNDLPYGIETDRNYIYITYGDHSVPNVAIYKYDKKAQLIKIIAAPSSSNTTCITTNGKHLILSRSTAALDTADKKGNVIRSAVATTNTATALSFNGTDILSTRSGSANVDVLDAKSYQVKKTIAIGAGATGICALTDRFIVITNSGSTMDYYSYKGNLIKSVALPTAGATIIYRDIAQDKDYLWLISYPSADIEPPVDGEKG